MIRPMLAALALSAAALGAPAMAQDAATVVATVNGEEVTLGQMIVMRGSLNPQMTGGMDDQQLWDMMLDQLVRQTAVAQERTKTPSARDEAVLELERRGYLSTAVLEGLAEAEPTEDELRAAYDAAFGENTAPKVEYNAAHILAETEDEAKTIAEELAGGADFGTLAEERSTDNSSANKGDLGWFTPEMMVQPFADAVVALEPGQVSEPVQSQFGWHVIRLIEQRTQEAPGFDEVRDQLALQVRRDRVQTEIDRLFEAATIETTEGFDPALMNNTELLD